MAWHVFFPFILLFHVSRFQENHSIEGRQICQQNDGGDKKAWRLRCFFGGSKFPSNASVDGIILAPSEMY